MIRAILYKYGPVIRAIYKYGPVMRAILYKFGPVMEFYGSEATILTKALARSILLLKIHNSPYGLTS